MIKITARMDWLEKQIKMVENSLMNCPLGHPHQYVHEYNLKKLTDEWCMRTERGEVSHATAALAN